MPAPPLIKVMIVDDHHIFRDGLKVIISKHLQESNIIIVAEASNGEEAIALVEMYVPDIILMDVQMPVMNGIHATKIIKRKYKHTNIIALSTFNESYPVLSMLDAGAKGFLLKNTSVDELMTAITTVFNGGSYFTPETSIHLVKRIESERYHKKNDSLLSEREVEIMRMVCEGYCNKEIAGKTGLTKRTIDSYRNKIMEKIDAKNVMDLFSYALQHGIYKLSILAPA